MAQRLHDRVPTPSAVGEALRASERHAWRRARRFALALPLLVGSAYAIPSVIPLAFAITFIPDASGWLVTALTARSLRRRVPADCLRVTALGWKQIPYARNYAIFAMSDDPTAQAPALVVRVASKQTIAPTSALLLGSTGRWRRVAVLREDGELLAVGGVRTDASARFVWGRKYLPTPPWPPAEKPRSGATA
jgi:hypothetical protein